MKDSGKLEKRLAGLLSRQSLAVLSTSHEGRPYASLVAFSHSSDLRHLFFATLRATRKYTNLSRNPEVALLVDNRSNDPADFHQAIAATAIGAAQEVTGPEREKMQAQYLIKHPHLASFVASPGCAFFRITAERYFIVSRFQNVEELHIRNG